MCVVFSPLYYLSPGSCCFCCFCPDRSPEGRDPVWGHLVRRRVETFRWPKMVIIHFLDQHEHSQPWLNLAAVCQRVRLCSWSCISCKHFATFIVLSIISFHGNQAVEAYLFYCSTTAIKSGSFSVQNYLNFSTLHTTVCIYCFECVLNFHFEFLSSFCVISYYVYCTYKGELP